MLTASCFHKQEKNVNLKLAYLSQNYAALRNFSFMPTI